MSSVNSRSDALRSSSLNQKYSLFWDHSLTPYVQTRASLRYFDLGIDTRDEEIFRREWQPSADLSWNTPVLALGAGARRRLSYTDVAETEMERDWAGFHFQTKSQVFPLLKLRYDANRTRHPRDELSGELLDQRVMGGVAIRHNAHTFDYNFNGNRLDNGTTGTAVLGTSHNAHWQQYNTFFNDRFRLGTDYTLGYRTQSTEAQTPEHTLQIQPFSTTAFARDLTPLAGELASVQGLDDGNVVDATQPPIDISRDSTDQNIALSFLTPREIDVLYVYTSRPSSDEVFWSVYTSTDAFIDETTQWEPIGDFPQSHFDFSVNRYEIRFAPLQARQVKIVNGGSNIDQSVYVTEIQALRSLEEGREIKFTSADQAIGLNGTWDITDAYSASFDLGFQNEPGASNLSKKKMTFIGP